MSRNLRSVVGACVRVDSVRWLIEVVGQHTGASTSPPSLAAVQRARGHVAACHAALPRRSTPWHMRGPQPATRTATAHARRDAPRCCALGQGTSPTPMPTPPDDSVTAVLGPHWPQAGKRNPVDERNDPLRSSRRGPLAAPHIAPLELRRARLPPAACASTFVVVAAADAPAPAAHPRLHPPHLAETPAGAARLCGGLPNSTASLLWKGGPKPPRVYSRRLRLHYTTLS